MTQEILTTQNENIEFEEKEILELVASRLVCFDFEITKNRDPRDILLILNSLYENNFVWFCDAIYSENTEDLLKIINCLKQLSQKYEYEKLQMFFDKLSTTLNSNNKNSTNLISKIKNFKNNLPLPLIVFTGLYLTSRNFMLSTTIGGIVFGGVYARNYLNKKIKKFSNFVNLSEQIKKEINC